MQVISTAAHTLHRHHPVMKPSGGFSATLCSQIVAGITYWVTPKEAWNIAQKKVAGYKLCRHCFAREDCQDLHLGVDPVAEPRLAFQRAYKAGETTYRAVKLLEHGCGEKATVDAEWATGHPISLVDPDQRENAEGKVGQDDGVTKSYYPDQHEPIRFHTFDCPKCGLQVS